MVHEFSEECVAIFSVFGGVENVVVPYLVDFSRGDDAMVGVVFGEKEEASVLFNGFGGSR